MCHIGFGTEDVKTNKLHEKLTPQEHDRFLTCEEIIRAYGKAHFEAGRALAEIRDQKLYREKYRSFARYCAKTLGWSRSKADRAISAWRISEVLAPIGVTISCESQARPLIGLNTEDIRAAAKHASELAGSAAAVTAEHFRNAAGFFKPRLRKKKSPGRQRVNVGKLAAQLLDRIESSAKRGNLNGVLTALAALRHSIVTKHRSTGDAKNSQCTAEQMDFFQSRLLN